MNYRHAYHAGNHGDVLKHIVLARVLEHLKKKEKPFRVLDLYAGIGLYDLRADEAMKTGEWHMVWAVSMMSGAPVLLSNRRTAHFTLAWRDRRLQSAGGVSTHIQARPKSPGGSSEARPLNAQ